MTYHATPLDHLGTLACILITVSSTSHRTAVLTFVAGIGLGYFLELWGTTRECWTYYTEATTPLFTILAPGLAATAGWRVTVLVKRHASLWGKHKQHFGNSVDN